MAVFAPVLSLQRCMPTSRRVFFGAAAAGLSFPGALLLKGAAPSEQYGNEDCPWLEAEIQKAFEDLPGRKGLSVWAPRSGRAPEFLAELHGNERLFSASANKAFILCERLRQLQGPRIQERLTNHGLNLNDSVWSIGSTVFNPPYLSGLVSERTAMEAMVMHSDNTATDMILKEATAKSVREFVSSIDLKNTVIGDSTRSIFAYLYGASNYLTITWEELLALTNGNYVHPVLNDVETLASSASDLVSFYARALQGEFFDGRETLEEFRRILSLGDITSLVPFPIGINAFGKAGYWDSPGQHARCIAGGMYFPDRWVYFAMILNWDAAEKDDPETVAAYFHAIRTIIKLLREALGS